MSTKGKKSAASTGSSSTESRYEKSLSRSASKVLAVDASNKASGIVKVTSPMRKRPPNVPVVHKKPLDPSQFDIMSTTVDSMEERHALYAGISMEGSVLSHLTNPTVQMKPKEPKSPHKSSIVDRSNLAAIAVPTAVVDMNELFHSLSIESSASPPRAKSPLLRTRSKIITDTLDRPITPMTPKHLRKMSAEELGSLADELLHSMHYDSAEPDLPTTAANESVKLPSLSRATSSKGLIKPVLKIPTHNLSLNEGFNDSIHDTLSRSTHKLSVNAKSKSSAEIAVIHPSSTSSQPAAEIMMIGEAGFEAGPLEIGQIQEIEGSIEPLDVSVLTPPAMAMPGETSGRNNLGTESDLLTGENTGIVAGVGISATVTNKSNSNTARKGNDIIYTDEVDGFISSMGGSDQRLYPSLSLEGGGEEAAALLEATQKNGFVMMPEVVYKLKGKVLTRNQTPTRIKRGGMAVSKSTSALPSRAKSPKTQLQQEHDAAMLQRDGEGLMPMRSLMESPLTFGVGSDFDDDNLSETSTVSSVLKKSRERRKREKTPSNSNNASQKIEIRIAADGSIYNANADPSVLVTANVTTATKELPVSSGLKQGSLTDPPRTSSPPLTRGATALTITAPLTNRTGTAEERSVDSSPQREPHRKPRSVKLMPQNSVHSFEGSISSASYRASLQKSLDLGSGAPPPPMYKLDNLSKDHALSGILTGFNQKSLLSINDSLSKNPHLQSSSQHRDSIMAVDGNPTEVPFQVHKRIMGWKLTSVNRRRDLVSILDVVTNKDPQGVMNAHGSTRKLPSLNKVKSSLLSMNVNIVSVQEGSEMPDIVPMPSQSVKEISEFQVRQSKAWQNSVTRLVKFRQSYSSVVAIRALVKDQKERNRAVQQAIKEARKIPDYNEMNPLLKLNNNDVLDDSLQYDPNYDSLLRTWTRAADRLSAPKDYNKKPRSRGLSPKKKDLYNYPTSINRPSDRMDIINAVNTRLLFDALDDQTKNDLIVNDFLQNKYKHSRTDNSTVGDDEEDSNMLEMGGLFDEHSHHTDNDDLSSLGGMSLKESIARSLGLTEGDDIFNDEDCNFERELHERIPVNDW